MRLTKPRNRLTKRAKRIGSFKAFAQCIRAGEREKAQGKRGVAAEHIEHMQARTAAEPREYILHICTSSNLLEYKLCKTKQQKRKEMSEVESGRRGGEEEEKGSQLNVSGRCGRNDRIKIGLQGL